MYHWNSFTDDALVVIILPGCLIVINNSALIDSVYCVGISLAQRVVSSVVHMSDLPATCD